MWLGATARLDFTAGCSIMHFQSCILQCNPRRGEGCSGKGNPLKVKQYIGLVESEGNQFANAAALGDWDVEIAACAGWSMRDLVRHLGMIHLWAAANVAFPEPDWLDVDELPDLVRYWPELTGESGQYPDDDGLVDWYRSTLANLVDVLKSAPADVEAFTFLPAPSPLSMWARRQANEIAVHRFDAEEARGITSNFDPLFAADMIDEVLVGFAGRPRPIDIESPKVLHLHADDTDDHWYVTITADGFETSSEGDHADLTITGTASDLNIVLWNRAAGPSITMVGNTDVFDYWANGSRVRWA